MNAETSSATVRRPNERQERLRAAERRIFEHPAHKAYLECLAFERTITVFTANLRELMALLDQAATDHGLAFELIQNVHKPVVRDGFNALVTQRLHNALASTGSVADHAIRIRRKRAGELAAEYDRRLADLRKHPEIAFIRRLRDYTLHRELPFLGHTLTLNAINTPGQTMQSEVELSVSELLQWKKWGTVLEAFLQHHGRGLPLRSVLRRHGDLVTAFNIWWLTELANENAPRMDELNELVVARNAELSGDDLETARHRTDELTAQRATLPRAAE